MPDYVWWIVFAPLAFHGLIALTFALTMFWLRSCRLIALDARTANRMTDALREIQSWAAQNGFEEREDYRLRVMNSLVFGWPSHTEPGTFLCAYRVANRPEIFIDFVTIFSADAGLTTGSTRDGVLSPKPSGHFMQCFEDLRLADQWRKHAEAQANLRKVAGLRPQRTRLPFRDVFEASVRATASHALLRQPWWLMVTYWYFVRRHRMVNLTIKAQHERGMVRIDPFAGS